METHHHERYSEQTTTGQIDKTNKSATKKRFLTRGSGTAGGKQGHG
jgi:hypothetical protein